LSAELKIEPSTLFPSWWVGSGERIWLFTFHSVALYRVWICNFRIHYNQNCNGIFL